MTDLILPNGGYRKLKCFRQALLSYDLTGRSVELYINPRNRIRAQVVQSARSEVQNIAECSAASGISKKPEFKLTNAAISSVLLDKLISHLADVFTDQGGFTERIFQFRSAERSNFVGRGLKN